MKEKTLERVLAGHSHLVGAGFGVGATYEILEGHYENLYLIALGAGVGSIITTKFEGGFFTGFGMGLGISASGAHGGGLGISMGAGAAGLIAGGVFTSVYEEFENQGRSFPFRKTFASILYSGAIASAVTLGGNYLLTNKDEGNETSYLETEKHGEVIQNSEQNPLSEFNDGVHVTLEEIR